MAEESTSCVSSRQTRQSATKGEPKVNRSPTNLAREDNSNMSLSYGSAGILPMNAYHEKVHPLICIGERGHGLSQFYYPVDVAVSPAGDRIYVVDSDNCRVQIFDNRGEFVGTFGSYGHEKGEHNWWPTGIAVNRHGHVIVSNCNSLNSIGVYTRDGTFKYSFCESGSKKKQLDHPMGVAVDNSDNIYVCDTWNQRVQVFQHNGVFLWTLGSGDLSHPAYIAVAPGTNNVYVTDWDKHSVNVFSNHGEFLSSFGSRGEDSGQMSHPSGIVVDEQGFIIVSERDNNRIQVFCEDGTSFCRSASGSEIGQFNQPRGIALTKHGKVIIADSYNHRVQIF